MTKTRYKCSVILENQPLIFKRYGETEEQVRTELLAFIKEAYGLDAQIVEALPDKTHPVEKQEQLENANTTESTGQTNV